MEVMRETFDAWNRGDIDAWLGMWDEEAEFYLPRAQLEGVASGFHGAEGLRGLVAELAEVWESYPRMDLVETRDAGDQVMGLIRFRGRARASGVELDLPMGAVAVIRNKKILYCRFFSDPYDALKAVGLRE